MSAALMTATELAVYLGKSRFKIRKYTEQGILPTFVDPESQRTMYPRAAIDAWLASHAQQTAS